MSVSDQVPVKRTAILVSAVVLFFVLSCGTTLAAAHQPTPPDSYLTFKVYTVDQLIAQVESNPVVRLHYSKTFHVPESKVVQYIRNNVVESYVQETGKYTVYCVRPDGLIYPTVQHFRRGTKVFALRNGQPVMKWACGNPLMNFLPAVHEVVKSRVITKVSPSVETLVPAEQTEEEVPVEEVAPVYQPKVPVMASPTAVTAPITAASHISPLALLPIALLPTFGGHSGTTGGTTGGTTTGGTTTGGTTTGGTTTGGTTTGGTTTGGTTTGGTTSGSTTSGTTTSGSTTSGTTTSGSTTSGTTTSGTTTSGAVPEAAPGSTVALGFIALGVAALIASLKKPRKA